MSQVSNKVKWCLNKAQKELEESGLHRGLVLGQKDKAMALQHIAKAEHNLRAATFFEQNGYGDWSASAIFYCIYHCFLAVLRYEGYESRNQECTIAVIELLKEEGKIPIDDKLINAIKITSQDEEASVIKLRENFQYGIALEFTKKEQFAYLLQLCKQALAATKDIIYEENNEQTA